jgi:hypothetical protein
MLLTDGNPNNTEDLRAYESEILSLANTEGIDLSVKLGLATEEVAQDVLDFLVNGRGSTDPQAGRRRELGVSDVVVTRQLKRWHVLHALELVHRDGFHNQLNDRYKAKFFEYRKLAKAARAQTLQFGVGLTNRPLPVAGLPEFDSAPGTFEATTYYVRVAWVGADGQESLASPATTYDAAPGSVPVVKTVKAPTYATGYHVYMGLSEDGVSRQTSVAIGLTQAFTMPSTGLIEGAAPGDGQRADRYIADLHLLRRG